MLWSAATHSAVAPFWPLSAQLLQPVDARKRLTPHIKYTVSRRNNAFECVSCVCVVTWQCTPHHVHLISLATTTTVVIICVLCLQRTRAFPGDGWILEGTARTGRMVYQRRDGGWLDPWLKSSFFYSTRAMGPIAGYYHCVFFDNMTKRHVGIRRLLLQLAGSRWRHEVFRWVWEVLGAIC